ncbi:MAG: hypothetical protein AAGA18_01180 [Verrucomicrobiota bacterium]
MRWKLNKKIVTDLLSLVGFIAIILLGIYSIIRYYAPDFYRSAMSDFGTPERIEQLKDFYDTLEEKGLSNPELSEYYPIYADFSYYSQAKLIPKQVILKNLKGKFSLHEWGSGYDNVLAIFDANDELCAIEFIGSRYGCYISRIPNFNSVYYDTIHRVVAPSDPLAYDSYYISIGVDN